MGFSLTPETQRLIEERMKLGGYSDANELVRAAIGALEAFEIPPLDEDTLAAIERAEEKIERGETKDWADVRQELRARFLAE